MGNEIFLQDNAAGKTYRLGVEKRVIVLTETADVPAAKVILRDQIKDVLYSLSVENGVLKLLEEV